MRDAVRVLGAALLCVGAPVSAATLTVTNASDSGPGSLRQAILDANATAGVFDTIVFDIPGDGPFLNLISSSHTVTDRVLIDATTQPGWAGLPLFQIRPGTFNGSGMVLTSSAAGSTVRGLAFADLAEGLRIEGNFNLVESCFFGTDPTGTSELGNETGVAIVSADDNIVGLTTAAGNLISGNSAYGIRIVDSFRNLIRGNRIGTTLDGQTPLGNAVGISISGGIDNTIGARPVTTRNVISGNAIGIEVLGGDVTGIHGNYIGTNATGLAALPNGTGIRSTLSNGVWIGGGTPGMGNVVSGNEAAGIVVAGGSDGTLIEGNAIGVDAAGDGPLGNGYGIVVEDAATIGSVIGGIESGQANQIAYNGTGIWNLGTGTWIRGNSIHDNAGLGIDHETPGPTPNDPGESDPVQNFPLIEQLDISPLQEAAVRIRGILQTNPGDYILDFYANPPCATTSREYLEGETWIGAAQLTSASGFEPFDVMVPVSLEAGARVSATATLAGGGTSEFSQRLPFSITPPVGPTAGGTDVEISGTNFEPGLTATIGGVPLADVVFGSSVSFTAKAPALPSGAHDVTVTNPSGTSGTIPRGWIAEFADVPSTHPFYVFVATLVSSGFTEGVGAGVYGVDQPTLREQAAVVLLKARHGICYVPPPCAGAFADVPCPSPYADWIEALAEHEITSGCGASVYCPSTPIRRDQMAVFVLKVEHGPTYVPPPCAGIFADVPCPSPFADWIEQLAAEQITGGCGAGNYCPLNSNTRGQMAVFLVKTFGILTP